MNLNFLVEFGIAVVSGMIFAFIAVPVIAGLGSWLQLWRTLPEKTVLVYTLFGKEIGEVAEPGVYFPLSVFGPRALLLPFFGKCYTVDTRLSQSYIRNQLVNSEEGAPMGVGIWFEMFVNNPSNFLFKNANPRASLAANVSTAVVKKLSNLKLETLLEDRNALSKSVREEVTPTSSQWGFSLGSTYIRKVAFSDKGMKAGIELKVVNRLRQVTAGMKQEGDNQVAIIRSKADQQASERLGEAAAVRPKVVGGVLAEVRKEKAVADALFDLMDINATLKSPGKTIIVPHGGSPVLLNVS